MKGPPRNGSALLLVAGIVLSLLFLLLVAAFLLDRAGIMDFQADTDADTLRALSYI